MPPPNLATPSCCGSYSCVNGSWMAECHCQLDAFLQGPTCGNGAVGETCDGAVDSNRQNEPRDGRGAGDRNRQDQPRDRGGVVDGNRQDRATSGVQDGCVGSCCGDPCCGDPCCGDPCCGDPCCGDPCCGDPCCGDPCCGDPCCGDPCCGDACCGDPCCGDPCCGDPCCGDPCCGDACCGDACCGDPCCGDCSMDPSYSAMHAHARFPSINERAAFNLACPRDEVALANLGDHRYLATGCGKAAHYRCACVGEETDSCLVSTCRAESAVVKVPAAPHARGFGVR